MIDFTLKDYKKVLAAFLDSGVIIMPVKDFFKCNLDSNLRVLILRHDVDRFPKNAVKMAKMEHSMGVQATYYFRIKRSVYKESIIRKIQDLGHEVSYHYEDLSLKKGDYNEALEHFKSQLAKFRLFAPAVTICRHGSPLSKWDNILLWRRYNYKDFGIVCDTELDFNFNQIFYISDNGMGWNKFSCSIRDKVSTTYSIEIKNTNHMIQLINLNKLPNQIMINAHPDTFFDFGLKWVLNYLFIKTKNMIKYLVVKFEIIK